jgi:hypothetical protein
MSQAIPQALLDWPEDVPIDLDHPLVPEDVRFAVIERYEPGDFLIPYPSLTLKKQVIIEWWLFDRDGKLIEAFWEK